MAVLGLRYHVDFSLVAVSGLLIAVASLIAERGLQGTWASAGAAHGLSSCSSPAVELRFSTCDAWAWLLHGMGDVSRPGIEPVFPALAGRFFTTEPPGKPLFKSLVNQNLEMLSLKAVVYFLEP